MHKVSVIVPVYNVSSYLCDCVDSLLSQTYENIEIILVDDGSPDDCPTLCDSYAEKYEKVIVVHKANGGLSSARNAGIQIATGDFLAFVDADDYVDKGYIECLLDACINNNCEISACGYFEYYSSENFNIICGDNSTVFSSDDAIKNIFIMKNDICVVAWNKLYAARLFKECGISYPVGKIHEDVFTTYKLCSMTNTVAYVNKPLYYYVQRKESIMGQVFSPKRLQLLEAVDSIKPFVEKNSPQFDEEYNYYVFLNYLTLLNKMADSNYRDKKMFLKLRRSLFDVKKQLSGNKYFGFKHKLTCLFMCFGMNLFYQIRRVYKRM